MRKVALLMLCLTTTMIISLSAQNFSCNKWQVLDMSFTAKGKIDKPLDLNFGAVLRHESGKTLNVPGFFNDKNKFVIRFCPSLEGNWGYHTYSGLPGLAGLKGSVTVGPNKKADRHGPVRISEKNKKRFEYEDGTPYFSLAFEIDWLFALDAENKTSVPRTIQMLDHLAEYRFNKAIMNFYAYDARWGEREKIDPKYNFAKPNVFPFGGTNDKPDHSTLNIDFFKHMDRVMHELNEREIISHLMIYVWNKLVNWPKPGSNEDNMYFDYVVKRYQAYPNLIWDISKEALAYGMDDMDYISSRIDRLRRLDGHQRLVTVHDYAYCRTFPNKVDFISVQEWIPNLYNSMLDIAKSHPNMPIYNVEHGAYEKTMHSIFNGAYTDSIVCLDRTYTCFFSGVYSTYYWQNASWYELVYEPFALPEANQPKFKYYKILMEFFDQFDFNTLKTSQYLYSPFCLNNGKDIFLYYVPRDIVTLEGVAPPEVFGKKISVTWFNPLTAEYSEPEYREMKGDWTGFRKPSTVTSPMALVVMRVVE